MSDWKFVRVISKKKIGHVWLVQRKRKEKIETGYFKFIPVSKEHYVGPLLGNEYLAYRLAKELQLPVAKIVVAAINHQLGVVSIVKQGKKPIKWGYLKENVFWNLPRYIKGPERILEAFVFDTWICNIDRHSGNIMVYPTEKKYDFYLIDHGLSLSGVLQWRKKPWNHPYWDHLVTYKPRYVKGLVHYLRHYSQVAPYIKKIQSIPFRNIEEMVEDIPASLYTEEQKKVILNLLSYRQKNLHRIISLWFDEFRYGRSRYVRS